MMKLGAVDADAGILTMEIEVLWLVQSVFEKIVVVAVAADVDFERFDRASPCLLECCVLGIRRGFQ